MNVSDSSAIPNSNEGASADGVRALADLCRDHGVDEIEATDGVWSVRLRLDRSALRDDVPQEHAELTADPGAPYVLLSQWVGVFHRAADAGARSYVEEGQTVAEGDIVGVIAAMQLQLEVRIDRSGSLGRFLVQDGTA